MFTADQSQPLWLHDLLSQAVAKGWCTRTNCTTCGAEQLRQALGLLEMSERGHPRFLPMSSEAAAALIEGLRQCDPDQTFRYRLEEPARWVLYEIWRNVGDQHFSRLAGTWAGEVLGRMQAHHARRQEARRIHSARQGVKKRDWKD